MIALLRGRIAASELDRAIIDVGGVGYEIFATRRALATWSTEDEITVHVSTQVRAESISLFGFQEPDERLAEAVLARQELDLRVGVAFTRFCTRHCQGRRGRRGPLR